MALSRGKLMVSLTENNKTSAMIDDNEEDEHIISYSNESSFTINRNEHTNPEENLSCKKKDADNLTTFKEDKQLVSPTDSALLVKTNDVKKYREVEDTNPEESRQIDDESQIEIPQWKVLEPTVGGTKLRLKRFPEKRQKPIDWSSDSDIIDDTDSDPDFDLRNEYVREKRSLLFNFKKFGKKKHTRCRNEDFIIDQPSCSTSTASNFLSDNYVQDNDDSQINAPNGNHDVVVGDMEIENMTKKTKKKQAQPSKWRKNEAKLLRNSGKPYLSSSKSKKEVCARGVKAPCGENCRLKCSQNINQEQRIKIFTQFWALADITRQREFVSRNITCIQPKYRYANPDKLRRLNNAFYFSTEGGRIRVCKIFFTSTLDIPYRFIRTVLNKMDKGFLEEDLRGKHGKHKTVEPEKKETAREHIRSIPRIESHYLRKQTTREFIEGGKSVADLFRDYKEDCINKNKLYCSPSMYSHIFNYEFNISPFVPKKDQCDFCTSYKLSNEEEKLKLNESYDLHLKEKELSRDEKEEDKKKVDKTYIVACYDLQAVFPVPKGEVSSFYYKSKLNCLNFTICELKTNDVHCYAWHEGEGGRGVNELGTCVYNFIKEKSVAVNDENLEIVFYSDNCGGQQKNKYMIAMYAYAVSILKVKSITHKYLIKGHTQNEGDSAHSVIEKATKRALKSGPVYVPDQFFTIIRTARKTGSPFKVNEMCHRDFIDLKQLYIDCGYTTTSQTKMGRKKSKEENTKAPDSEDQQDFKMTKAHIIRVEKKDPNCILYKNLYSDKEFNKETLKVKRRHSIPIQDVIFSKAYGSKLNVGERKKTDILSLVEANLVPQYYKEFYLNL